MATKETKYTAKTQFSEWLRHEDEINSDKGYITTDLDYIWMNYHNEYFYLLEEKRGSTICVTFPQRVMFQRLHKLCRKDKNYKGFHEITFENTSPEDGKIWINDIEVNKSELILFLKFDKSILRRVKNGVKKIKK
jgi:hypothetical protein